MPTSPQSSFPATLRRLREAAGISIYRLAQISGLSKSYLGALERGTKQPSLETLRALTVALGQRSLGCWD